MKWAAALTVAAATVGLTSGACSSGFECVDGVCLYFMLPTGIWTNQRSTCQIIAAPTTDLAKVDSELHNAIYQYIMDETGLQDTCIWLGGSDEDSEGHWTWVYDTTDIAEGGPQWDPCEPEPDGGYDENYLAICPDMYYFKDYPASSQFPAICQEFGATCP